MASAPTISAAPPTKSTVKKLPTGLERDMEDARLLVQVIEYYHQSLLQSPEASSFEKTSLLSAVPVNERENALNGDSTPSSHPTRTSSWEATVMDEALPA